MSISEERHSKVSTGSLSESREVKVPKRSKSAPLNSSPAPKKKSLSRSARAKKGLKKKKIDLVQSSQSVPLLGSAVSNVAAAKYAKKWYMRPFPHSWRVKIIEFALKVRRTCLPCIRKKQEYMEIV